jgi:hypothetical protein
VVDGQRYLSNPKSKFHGMRNAETFEEWVSRLHYIVLMLIRKIHHLALPQAKIPTSLSGRCLHCANEIRKSSFGLKQQVYFKGFYGVSTPLAIVLGTNCLWTSFAKLLRHSVSSI